MARAAELMREYGFEVPGDSLESDLARLRQSRQECESSDDTSGRQTGTAWACKHADYASLRRVAALSLDEACEDAAAAMTLASATLDDERPSWSEVNEEMEHLFGSESPSTAEIAGFIAGATEIHDQV